MAETGGRGGAGSGAQEPGGASALGAGEGRVTPVGPRERIVWKVTGDRTGGGLDVGENVTEPGAGPPLHVHHASDEAYYVLEGTVAVRVGARTLTAPPGTFVFIPRGTAHAFMNAGARPARLLLTFSPGGVDRFFDELAPLVAAESPAPARLAAVGARHRVEVVGPPLEALGVGSEAAP
jgi:mannose-6-phosphate isomerase-like protein (cupin superfamily)